MNYVDEYLAWVWDRRETKDQRWARYPARFWVSSLGSCQRKQIVQRQRVPGATMSKKKARFFEDRTAMHDLRITAWWERGLALTADLPDWHPDKAKAKFTLTTYMPEHFGGRPDILGHLGNPEEVEFYRGLFWRMVQAHEQGNPDNHYAEELRSIGTELTDMKTARPAMLENENYKKTLPKPGDVGQVGWYAHIINDTFNLGIDHVRIVYCPIGSEKDDLECVVPLPSKEDLAINSECAELVEAWQTFQESTEEDPWRRPLPPILDFDEQVRNDKSYQKVVFRVVPWQCDYCWQYNGHGCEPVKTVNASGDRFAVEQGGERIYVQEWCKKFGIAIPDGANWTRLAKDVR